MGNTGRAVGAGVAGVLLVSLALAAPVRADSGGTAAAPDTAVSCAPALRVLKSLAGPGDGNPWLHTTR
ncbi:hypothetical protein [Streptomyces sp. Isolate_45]|uniref:hypothetical protein n=1 Tax=Streptomyces sp. Isolate_45 TaxID=2950111 RepID=UPI002481B141|nr:hypothetical protein [Streptomyces sp. Isolate_45]MDA5285142.1 hypothetical protein [Streptomyces sp. Isolate_45]